MADSTLKEAIRLVLETEGREGVDALRKSLASIGDVSADTVADTDRLLDSLAGLNETAAKATRFAEMSKDLEATTKALDDTSRAALQLSLQMAETEKPSKEMQRTYKDVREEVTRLEGVQRKQVAAQALLGDELRTAGVDTATLATANVNLRRQIEGATTALQKQVGVVERQAEVTRRQRQATADADEQFRKMAASGQVSAEAMRQYRERAAAATTGTKALGGEVGRTGAIFGRLRGFIAPVLGFLTLRSAKEGIKNLLGVGAAAESARRSLGNLYGDQAKGNQAYKDLKQLALDSGLAFASVLDDAKKLKAFGLDPLNGSYQALVDQNAAVGGTQEDLSGKVLALGQAWAKQKLQGEEILQLVERGVPVWDLLQKATGKNVQELQKLSAAGKLGRGTIQALYEEIGRSNAGAANRNLSAMSGLVSQVSARWQEFLQKVADGGVTDYFKQQIQSLLGTTGDMDALAKRVADGIIATLEALKRLGQQVLAIGKPIAAATLALARHADAVVLLGKVYVALKLTRWANEFIALQRAQLAATAATQAATAAEAARATGLGRLGGLIGSLPKTIQIGLLVAGLDFTLNSFIKLNAAIDYRRDALAKVAGFERAQGELQQEQLRLGQQLQSLYKDSADVVVRSAADIAAMTRDQAQGYQVALEQARQYFGGVIRESRAAGDAQREAAASEHWKALGVAITAVKDRVNELDSAAAGASGFKLLANAAVESFDKVLAKTQSTKEAVNDIFKGIDFTQADGLKQAVGIIDQLNARGTAAGKAVQAELRTALAGVANEDLPKLKAAAEAAFGSGTEGAKLFAAEVDRINLTRLGVDVDAIKTGFTDAGRAAVDGFRGAIEEVDKLGLTAEQRSAAIAQAFDNAFKQASTQTELKALKQALQDALSAGDLGFAEFGKRVAEVDAKLAELSGTGKQVGTDIASGANEASDALSDMATSAGQATRNVERVGEAARDAGDRSREGAEGVRQMAFGLTEMSQEAVQALQALNKFAGQQEIWQQQWNDTMGQIRSQKDGVAAVNDELDAQLAKLDPLTQKVEQLKSQYQFVDDASLRAIAEKQQRLEQERKRLEEESRRAAEDARRLQEEASRAQESTRAATQPSTPAPARGTPAAASAAVAAGAGTVLATLRLQVIDGDTVDLHVSQDSALDLLRVIKRAQSVSTRSNR